MVALSGCLEVSMQICETVFCLSLYIRYSPHHMLHVYTNPYRVLCSGLLEVFPLNFVPQVYLEGFLNSALVIGPMAVLGFLAVFVIAFGLKRYMNQGTKPSFLKKEIKKKKVDRYGCEGSAMWQLYGQVAQDCTDNNRLCQLSPSYIYVHTTSLHNGVYFTAVRRGAHGQQ